MSKYVVRGKDQGGRDVWAIEHPYEPEGYAPWPEGDGDPDDYPAHQFDSLTVANYEREGLEEAFGCTNVRVFEVSDDGKETALPSYEELLDTAQAHRAKCLNSCGCSICILLRKIEDAPRRGDGGR